MNHFLFNSLLLFLTIMAPSSLSIIVRISSWSYYEKLIKLYKLGNFQPIELSIIKVWKEEYKSIKSKCLNKPSCQLEQLRYPWQFWTGHSYLNAHSPGEWSSTQICGTTPAPEARRTRPLQVLRWTEYWKISKHFVLMLMANLPCQ